MERLTDDGGAGCKLTDVVAQLLSSDSRSCNPLSGGRDVPGNATSGLGMGQTCDRAFLRYTHLFSRSRPASILVRYVGRVIDASKPSHWQ